VLVEAVVSGIGARLAGGATPAEVAKKLGLKQTPSQKAMCEGRVRTSLKRTPWRSRASRKLPKRECGCGLFWICGGEERNECAAFAAWFTSPH
jgi:hypothetical protein